MLTATGVREGAAGAVLVVVAGVAVWEVGPEVVEVVATDLSPGSLTVEVVELSVVTESGSTNSCVTVVLCAVLEVPAVAVVAVVVAVVVALVVVVAVVVLAVVAADVVDVLLELAVMSVEVVVAGLDAVVFVLDVFVVAAVTGGAGAGASKTAAGWSRAP